MDDLERARDRMAAFVADPAHRAALSRGHAPCDAEAVLADLQHAVWPIDCILSLIHGCIHLEPRPAVDLPAKG